ncbi:MAG TPA: alpha/beta hydrolase [Acidimicrobiales bacterium]
MPVTAEVKTILDLLAAMEGPPIEEVTPDEMRAQYEAMSLAATKADVASVSDHVAPGPAGDVPVRVYVPAGSSSEPRPVLVYFHGGGWVIGNIETHDPTARALAARSGVTVVSVDYRLAPEHPAPAALDDCVAAVEWVVASASELGIDPSRLAVGGDSAGGNLAAVVSCRLRDTSAAPRFQLLVYPVTDGTMGHPSYAENADGLFLTRDMMAWFWQHYVGSGSRTDPSVSPLHATASALEGLAPALVITAEFDPLRDEGEAYAARLSEAGVPCATTRYDGVIHGFFQMGDMIPEGNQALDEAADALRRALA